MSTEARERGGLGHDAVFYSDEEELVATAVRFVRDGVARGEVVLVNTGDHPVTPLLGAMFAGEKQVVVADRSPYQTPAGALDNYRRTMDRGLAAGARGFRAMGHIDLAAGSLPWQEWLRYEAAVNRVFAGYPLRTLCPYDTRSLSGPVATAMRRAHPGLVDRAGWRPNPEYVEPERLVREPGLRPPPHPLELGPPRMVLDAHEDLDDLRMEVHAATLFTDLPRRRVDEFASAVVEVTDNALTHGRPPVDLRLWASSVAVVCTVTDRGPGIADPLRGYARPRNPAEGLGMWAVRHLCDVVDYGPTEAGFTVRLMSSVGVGEPLRGP